MSGVCARVVWLWLTHRSIRIGVGLSVWMMMTGVATGTKCMYSHSIRSILAWNQIISWLCWMQQKKKININLHSFSQLIPFLSLEKWIPGFHWARAGKTNRCQQIILIEFRILRVSVETRIVQRFNRRAHFTRYTTHPHRCGTNRGRARRAEAHRKYVGQRIKFFHIFSLFYFFFGSRYKNGSFFYVPRTQRGFIMQIRSLILANIGRSP